LITIDADGQHDPEDIPRFVSLLHGASKKILLGARDFSRAEVPIGNRFGRKLSDFWVRLESGRPVFDSQSGFRAYPVELLADFTPIFNTYAFEVEVLVRGVWSGYEIENVDVSVSYSPNGGKRISHFNPFKDNFKLSLLHSRLVAERFLKMLKR
jgi:hypothetical protein